MKIIKVERDPNDPHWLIYTVEYLGIVSDTVRTKELTEHDNTSWGHLLVNHMSLINNQK